MRTAAVTMSHRSARPFGQSPVGPALLAAAAIACLAGSAGAQTFQRIVGLPGTAESVEALRRTSDQGFVHAGSTTSAAGNEDFYVVKHLPSGAVQWSSRFGAPGTDRTYSIRQNIDSTFIAAGRTNSLAPSFGLSLYKLDPAGNIIWNAAHWGESQFFDIVNPFRTVSTAVVDVRTTATLPENYAVATSIRNITQNPIGQFGHLLSVQNNGVPIFNRYYFDARYEAASLISFTDLRYDQRNQQFVISGTTIIPDQQPTVGGTGGGGDRTVILFVRTDLAGNVLLARTYALLDPQSNQAVAAYGDGITLAENGDVIIEGHTDRYSPGTPRHTVVLRLDPAGNPIWSTTIKDIEPHFRAVHFNAADTIGVVGTSPINAAQPGPMTLLSLTPGGAVINAILYGPTTAPDLGKAAAPLAPPSLGWVIAGDKNSPLGIGGPDILLAKTDDLGSSGCFEERYAPSWEPAPLLLSEIPLVPASLQGYAFWQAQKVDPNTREVVLCENNCTCPGDANFDNVVNFDDITAVLGNFGAGMPGAIGVPGDADCNGVVNFDDITTVLGNFGNNCN